MSLKVRLAVSLFLFSRAVSVCKHLVTGSDRGGEEGRKDCDERKKKGEEMKLETK